MVNLVILHESVACVLALEDWEVEGVVAPALFDIAGVQAMGAGATVHGEGPLMVAAIHLIEAGATVDHQYITVDILLCPKGVLAGVDVAARST